MQNKLGFIPKRYLQPDYYQNCFNAWCAVYIHPITDKEYHLQLELDHWDFDCKTVRHINILRKDDKCRTDMTGQNFKTIKSAVGYLQEKILI